VLLVGGSTRTPLVTNLLIQHTGLEPRQDVHPDLCVALGAGVLASRLAGHEVERVLVDVSPYSFGVSYLGERGGFPYPHCYKPIIQRNTPLPLTRTERYCTSHSYQTEVDIEVYQGDDEDALKNILVGDFHIDGLAPVEVPNEILCRMRLDLDGILEVTAVEKRTGKAKHVTIANALRAKTEAEIAAGRKRIEELYQSRGDLLDQVWDTGVADEEEEFEETAALQIDSGQIDSGQIDSGKVVVMNPPAAVPGESKAQDLMDRSRRLLGKMHADDREEAIDLHEKIETAIAAGDPAALEEASKALKELLFFVEGQQ